MLRKLNIIFVCLILLLIGGCSSSLDSVKRKATIYLHDGYFILDVHTNLFVYKPVTLIRRDKEVIHSKSFQIELPKGIKYYEITGSSDFIFYYEKKQAIIVEIYLDNKETSIDSSWKPNENEISKLVGTFEHSLKKKYDIRRIATNKNRQQLIIKKGAATILLYNIQDEGFKSFLKAANTFQFM